MKREWIHRAAGCIAAFGAALLTGCTSYVTTQVTAFSDWSGSDATRTYAFTRTDAQKNSIEQSTYEPIVANELSAYAFRQVPLAQARYLVGLSYNVGSDLVTVPQPVYYDPWFIGPGPYWRGGPWGPWGPWGPMPAGYVAQTYRVFDYTLGIRITERATGKEVYNVTARTTGDNGAMHQRDAVSRAQRARRFPACERRGAHGPLAGRQAWRARDAGFQRASGCTGAGVGRRGRAEIIGGIRRAGGLPRPVRREVRACDQRPTPNSASTPSTTNSTAAMPCTSLVGRRCAKRSPSRIAGTFASIMPNVVPATTPM